MNTASPRELHFYFGASLSFQGAEKAFGEFVSTGRNPLPSFCFSKPHFFLRGGTLLIISYEVITFWISRNNLWHLPFLHYHLKTITRPKRKQSFHLKIFGECVWESILVLLGHWVIKKKTLKNSFESELKHTAVGRSVWRQRKTRRYYFKQLSVWALALYKIMTVLVHKTVLKPTGFSCHSFSGLCKRSPDHPHWTSMQCLLTSGFEGNQQGPLHLLSLP